MPIVVNLDVMMAKRKMSSTELGSRRWHHARKPLYSEDK